MRIPLSRRNPRKKSLQVSTKKTSIFKILLNNSALSSAEKKKKPSIESMFDDVYDKRTPELERQYKARI